MLPEIWKEVEEYKRNIMPEEPVKLLHTVEYAYKRQRAMIVTKHSTIGQDWFDHRTAFELGAAVEFELREARGLGSQKFAHLVNIYHPLLDVMSLLYTLSELVGYIKSIRIADSRPGRVTTAEGRRDEMLRWLAEALKNPAAFNGLKTVKFRKGSAFVTETTEHKKWVKDSIPGDVSVQRLIQDLTHPDDWKNEEAFLRMTEGDAAQGPVYQPDVNDPQILGLGIVCTGVHMWDPSGDQSCMCSKGKYAPIFLGLSAMKECVGCPYPDASSYDALERLHTSLTPLMRHIDIANHTQTTVNVPGKPAAHAHEIGVYTRLYTPAAVLHRYPFLIDIAQFQEYVATWSWFLWNFRALKGDHREFVANMSRTWGAYRAIGLPTQRQHRTPPGMDGLDVYPDNLRTICGGEMIIGDSVHETLRVAGLIPAFPAAGPAPEMQ